MAKVGFVLSHEQFPAPKLIELGVAAEQVGFDMVWTSDHFHPWMHSQGHAGQAWITLAALGQRMPRIPMGTGVTCPTYRYRPAIVAQAFASLGVLYPGRVFLGVGTGEALNEVPASGQWGDYSERAERLIEAITIIKELWRGDWVDYFGKYYQIEKARLYDVPEQPIPLYMAAEGPKSMYKAGYYSDGLISDAKTAQEREMRAEFEDGARDAEKEPEKMPILAEHFVVVGGEDEVHESAQMWRFIPQAWDNFIDNPDPEAIEEEAEAKISDKKVSSDWVVSKDPAEHAAAIQTLFDAGITEVYVHSGQQDQMQIINFFGKEVLPRLGR